MRRLFSKMFFVCAIVAGFAMPAMAQDAPSVEVSGGYNFLRVDEENVPGGWYADVAGNLTPMFAVVGQITGNYKSIDVLGADVDTSLHTFMAGVRVNGRAAGMVPFGQVLVGAARAGSSTDAPVSFDESTTDAALQIGGGLKFMPGALGLQVGADYIRLFTEDEGTNAFRVAVGVVVGF